MFQEIDAGKISIRFDVNLYADLGVKDAFVKLLHSYSPIWLVVGLETVLGRVVDDYETGHLRSLIDKVS